MDGKEPPGLEPRIPWERIDSDSVVIPADQRWQELGALPGQLVTA
jgi:hypothetical protein